MNRVLRAGVAVVVLALAVLAVVALQFGRAPDPSRALRRYAAPAALDVAATGVPEGTVLTPSAGLVVTTDGAVVERLDITGTIDVRADDVVIRDTRVRATDPYLVRVHRGATGTRIENVELDGLGSTATVGIAGSDVQVRRADISGVVDGVKAGSRSRYEECWIHDLSTGDGAHADGIQVEGGRDILIRGNLIDASGANSALIVKADTGLIADVTVGQNVFRGGNYTLYVLGEGPRTSARHPASDVAVRANRFQGGYRYGHRHVASVEGFRWLGNEESAG